MTTNRIFLSVLKTFFMFPVRTVCLFCFLLSNPRKRSRRTLRHGSISLLCSVPDAPGSFTVSQVYCDAFKVSWGRPRRVNGRLIAHIVRHWRNDTSPSNGQTKRLPNTTLSAIVTGLRANTVYSVEIYAETRAGIGTSKTLSARTTQSPGEITDMFFVFCDVSEQTCRTFWAKLNDAHLFWNLLPLKLAHLKPCTFYRFRVIAANKIDSSSPSNPSDKIKTLETGE